MAYTAEQLDWIYQRTSGKCHICHEPLARCNYGHFGERGAWEVEHSVPRCKGGTNRLNNLYAAHISCNRSKCAVTTRTARSWHGQTRAPLCAEKRKEAVAGNTFFGFVGGGIAWAALLGPPGWILGAIGGAYYGSKLNPDKTG
jgi:hypothetical protein